jgi:predicted RNA binding protein YcfA (HicA-like mRNA interferase family)
MTRREKLLQKARNSPNNLRFSDLVKLVESYGFTFERQTGSHHIFSHPKLATTLNMQPRKDGKAKGYQVQEALAAITVLEEQEDA